MNFFSMHAEKRWRDELLPNEREDNSTLTSSKDRERKHNGRSWSSQFQF